MDTQTTTLEVSSPDSTTRTISFTCVVTDPSDGVTTEEETVDLVFYSKCRIYKIRYALQADFTVKVKFFENLI